MTLTMPVGMASWVWWAAERLLAGSLRGALVVLLVWLVCRRIANVRASARTFLWWLVSLALIAGLLPLPPIALPVLPALPIVSSIVTPLATPSVLPEVRVNTPVPLWLIATLAIWCAGIAVQAWRLGAASLRVQRIVRRATPVGPDDRAVVARLARLVAVSRPRVRISEQVVMPMVAGVMRPTVVLPARASTLSTAEREMAICHELAHVRRRDLVLGWIPAIAERLFFFHPLAHLAAREYAVEREAACDALVLSVMDCPPREYGEMLVRLGITDASPAFTASGASPSMSSLRRRLAMLDDLNSSRPRRGPFDAGHGESPRADAR